jgi:ATP-dependent RNA helicase RhlE
MTFDNLSLIPPLLRAVAAEGYTRPTPIQAQAIPHVLARRDLLGIAQTGTGKTAAFVLPIVQNLLARPAARRGLRVLVLAPTRELASQIGESFATYGKHTTIHATVIFGGVGQEPQVQALRRHPEVLVATPGRLLDLMNQRHVDLSTVEVLVLDEADRMLDMGFIHDVRKIVAAVPRKRQTLFLSATMPDEVSALAKNILSDPVRVEVTPVATTAEKIAQSVHFVDKADKRRLLSHLLEDAALARVLVFTRTKHGANRVVKDLLKDGYSAEAIHGNKGQSARERALRNFKDGTTRVLVATDIAARGIDVDGITHVVNFDLPNIPESYVHRIGRTARAGAEGIAISFCDGEERAFLADIEKLIRQRVPRAEAAGFRAGVRPRPSRSRRRRRRARRPGLRRRAPRPDPRSLAPRPGRSIRPRRRDRSPPHPPPRPGRAAQRRSPPRRPPRRAPPPASARAGAGRSAHCGASRRPLAVIRAELGDGREAHAAAGHADQADAVAPGVVEAQHVGGVGGDPGVVGIRRRGGEVRHGDPGAVLPNLHVERLEPAAVAERRAGGVFERVQKVSARERVAPEIGGLELARPAVFGLA